MKKLLSMAMFGAALTLASCSTDVDNSDSINAYIYNYVTRSNGQGDPKVDGCYYKFDFNWDQRHVGVTTDQINIGGENKLSFVYNALPLSSNGTGTTFWSESNTPVTASNGQQVTNFKFELNPGINLPPVNLPDANLSEDIAGNKPKVSLGFALPVAYTYQGPSLMFTKMSYEIGREYLVRTFWEDNVFSGTTNTTVNRNAAMGYQSDKPAYRVKLDMKKKKATVVLYNAKFNERMPEMNLILLDLDVNYTNSGIVVTGSNVVPRVMEGMYLGPNPSFPFTTFKFEIYGDLTVGRCEFVVTPDPAAVPNMPAGTTFEGGFTGTIFGNLRPAN